MSETSHKPDALDTTAKMLATALRREEGHGPQALAAMIDELETKICAAYWRMEQEEALKS